MSVRQVLKPKVQVSPNDMQATVRLLPEEDYSHWSADDVSMSLGEAGVPITDEVKTRIQTLLELIKDDQIPEDDYALAQGRPLVEPQDGKFERAEKGGDDEDEDRPVNFYEQTSVVTVEAGEEIGKTLPARPGEPGLNVMGEEIPTTRTPVEIDLRDSVQRGADGLTIFARVAGKINFRRGVLRIDEITAIKGNVDFQCGNIDSSVSVVIHGTVQDRFKVSSKGSITVGGHIEAADVRAAEDVSVRGGILGRNKGTVDAKGEITARFCDGAHIQAGGDLTFAKEVINSRVTAGGRLFVSHGSIIGGEVHGRQGVEARYLGSEGMIKTMISVGVPVEILKQASEIDVKIKKLKDAAARVREKVDPLLQMLKQLNGEQRAAASELSAQAHLMDFDAEEQEAQKQALLDQHGPSEGMDHVLVLNRIYPGVTLQFGDRVVTFNKEKRGPIRIERRQIKNVTEIVTVNQLTGSIFPLKSQRINIV